jgi:cytochrome c oxidase subunit 2
MLVAKRALHVFIAAALAVAALTAAYVAAQPAEPGVEVIKIMANKFDFVPAAVTLKKGVPVILELSTKDDVIMGFKSSDLGVREDVVPGKTTRVRVVPMKLGKVEFWCDVFCGSGHEEMEGLITAVE